MSWTALRAAARPYRASLLVVAVLSIFVGFAETGLLVILAQLAVSLSTGANAIEVSPPLLGDLSLDVPIVIGLALGTTVLRFVLKLLTALVQARMATQMYADVRQRVIGQYIAASWSQKEAARSGHLQETLTSFVAQSVAAVLSLSRLLAVATTFLILTISAFALDPIFAALIVAVIVILFAILRPVTRVSKVFTARSAATALHYISHLTQMIGQAREIEVYGVGAEVADRAEEIDRRLRIERYRASIVGSLVPDLYQTAAVLAVVGGLGVLYAVDAGQFATMTAIILLFVRSSSYGTQVASLYQQLQNSAPYLDRLTQVGAELEAARVNPGNRPLTHIESIRFDQVSFSYDRSIQAIEGLSFQVERGEMVGIIGPSGAGKSTLVELLLRLRAPQRGSYLVNGTDAHDFDRDSWTRRIGYVPQEPSLFAGTINENVSFFRSDVDDAAVADAIRRAHLEHDLEALPDGALSWVGDDGRLLSGGQRQRVVIARALVGNPDVIILDEPTSALDLQSEAAIQDTLEEIRSTCTMFVVAHRLSTLTNCDRLLVLESGRLTDLDTPDALAVTNPFYRKSLDLARTPSSKPGRTPRPTS